MPKDLLLVDTSKIANTHIPRIRMGLFPTTSGKYFVGREAMLAELDAAWDNTDTHIVNLVGMGGIGKTSLVRAWLERNRPNYRDAMRVFVWSFSGQGDREGMGSASDRFLNEALSWFSNCDNKISSWYERAYRLAELVREQPTLLILDGIEVLQNPPGIAAGRLAPDDPLLVLLRELVQQFSGLCLISSRISLRDLEACATVRELELAPLSDEYGQNLLESIGVPAQTEDLLALSRKYHGHPLCLTLVGHYLADTKGDIQNLPENVIVTTDQRESGLACQIMESYDTWIDATKHSLLFILALFDKPVSIEFLERFYRPPLITGLNEPLLNLTPSACLYLSIDVCKMGLAVTSDGQDTLELHPMVRNFFRERLKHGKPETYRAAHSHLYEYFLAQSPTDINSFDDIYPLYQVIYHGCEAGLHEQVFDEVIWKIILQNYAAPILHRFGVGGLDFVAVYRYFTNQRLHPDALLPSINTPLLRGRILFWVGLLLRHHGNIIDGIDFLQAADKIFIQEQELVGIWVISGFLARSLLFAGRVQEALEVSGRCYHLLRFSNKPTFLRIASRVHSGVLYHAGHVQDSLNIYQSSDKLPIGDIHDVDYLHGIQEVQYCELLVFLGSYEEVHQRIQENSNIMKVSKVSSIMMSLMIAELRLKQYPDTENLMLITSELANYVNQREYGVIADNKIRGLLLLTAAYRRLGKLETAKENLELAWQITHKYRLRLLEVDCLLEQARLEYAFNQIMQAAETSTKAEAMIHETGYLLRLPELATLQE
jgi:tetratricopeptide (TPR) repeat protein